MPKLHRLRVLAATLTALALFAVACSPNDATELSITEPSELAPGQSSTGCQQWPLSGGDLWLSTCQQSTPPTPQPTLPPNPTPTPATPDPTPTPTEPDPTPTPEEPTPVPTTGPPPPSECQWSNNPEAGEGDPNPPYNGTQGRYPVTSNPIPPGFPTPLTTGLCGAGISVDDLTPMSGKTIKTDGTIIDMADISGTINIQADNVTIRRSRITSSAPFAIRYLNGYTGLVVEDTRIISQGANTSNAVFWQGEAGRATRIHVTGGGDGFKPSGADGLLVEDSYISALYRTAGDHNDIVQILCGTAHIYRGNTLLGPWQQSTSVFLWQSSSCATRDIIAQGNYLSGGNGTFFTDPREHPMSNLAFRDNLIEIDSWNIARPENDFRNHKWCTNRAGAALSGNQFIDPITLETTPANC